MIPRESRTVSLISHNSLAMSKESHDLDCQSAIEQTLQKREAIEIKTAQGRGIKYYLDGTSTKRKEMKNQMAYFHPGKCHMLQGSTLDHTLQFACVYE